jgi:hypothetical protein
MISKPVLATDKEKTTLNWFEYWFGHCWMTGWQSIGDAFSIWQDLMSGNYEVYALPRTAEDPEEECIDWFWVSLGEDNVYPKEFLEHLMEMSHDVMTGKIETVPVDEDFFDRLEDLVKDVEIDSPNSNFFTKL